METNRSEQSIDEPNAKRPRFESVGSTTPKPKSKSMDPFLTLPADIITKIISYTPIAQWASLESLDTNFQSAAWKAWRQLRNLNFERELSIKKEISYDPSSFGKSIESILHKLVERSEFLTSLSGVGLQLGNVELNLEAIRFLAQFEHLQSIVLGDSTFFIGRQITIELANAVAFLESTQSRCSLKELRILNVIQSEHHDYTRILDRFASSFANGRDIQSPLKLEMFAFTSPDDELRIRLDTMDATRLSDVRLGHAWVEPDQLTSLVERASCLRQIDLTFFGCHTHCKGQRLEANKKLLTALATHECLTTIRFDCFHYFYDTKCLDFQPEFLDMLKSIGRRGQIKELAVEGFSRQPPTISMDEICTTIFNYIPCLRSLKLHDDGMSDGRISDIVSLTTLEEIYLANTFRAPMTAIVMKTIALLPHLKRLAIDKCHVVNSSSLTCLAEAATLTDLRIGDTRWITNDVLAKWSDGFVPNLQFLMLRRMAENGKSAENGLVRLLEKAAQLRVLILDGRITDRSLTAIAQSCPELEWFGMESTSNEITVEHLQAIVDRCTKLKRLGGIRNEIRNQLQLPKYRKIADMDMTFWDHDLMDGKYD